MEYGNQNNALNTYTRIPTIIIVINENDNIILFHTHLSFVLRTLVDRHLRTYFTYHTHTCADEIRSR